MAVIKSRFHFRDFKLLAIFAARAIAVFEKSQLFRDDCRGTKAREGRLDEIDPDKAGEKEPPLAGEVSQEGADQNYASGEDFYEGFWFHGLLIVMSVRAQLRSVDSMIAEQAHIEKVRKRDRLDHNYMKTLAKLFPFAAIVALFAACSSTSEVSCMPLPLRSKISAIYIENDPAAKVEVVLPQIVKQLTDMGFHVEIVEHGTAPEDGYILKYDARFNKKLNTLDYVGLEVTHNKRVVGYITSDASDSPEKFNSNADRLKPVIDRLFQFARPGAVKQ